MHNLVWILMLFFLNSCSFNTLFLSEDINKVFVVKHAPYFKYHRAYFERTPLKPIINKKKYHFLYHSKKQELALLLRNKHQYLLYNFSKPTAPTLSLKIKKGMTRKDALKVFKNKGYVTRNLKSLGYITTISFRRYKDTKTLMFEVKDYHRLKKLYTKAIKNYDAKKVKDVKTLLPKNLIYKKYIYYKKRARTINQLNQLQIIGNKLKFDLKIPKKKMILKKKTTSNKIPKKKKEVALEVNKEKSKEKIELVKEIEEQKKEISPQIIKAVQPKQEAVTIIPKKVAKGYTYYRHSASYAELHRYLSNGTTKSSGRHDDLLKHLATLKEQKLLRQGTLEELIAAYKINKNPKYKARILLLMKDKQDKKEISPSL